MAPSRRKGASKAAAAAAARRQWKVGDLVLAKVKGFPAWPATVSEPEKWGYSSDWKKVLVYFFGTQQIAFCNPADVEAFTEEKKQSLLVKRQGKGADFVRAVKEIIESYDQLKQKNRVDDPNSGEVVTLANGGNSTESSAHVESKGGTETSDATITGRNDPSLGSSVAPDASKSGSLLDKEASLEQATDDVVVPAKPVITTYTSRKRSLGPRTRKRASEKQDSSVERSRSFSRLESSRLQNLMMPSNDSSKNAGDGSSEVIMDRLSRRNKRFRTSPDTSEWDDVDSSAPVSNGSIEDNGSEVVTVDSDSLSLNEGSTIDSDCKPEHSETVVECMEGDVELSKGLDFQIKAVVIKKKRKANRKRVTNEPAEPPTRLEAQAHMDAAVHNSSPNSQCACETLNERHNKEDGDEHLPLVKRARVRMGKLLSLEEQHTTGFSQAEEKITNEVAMHMSRLQNGLCSVEEITSNEVAVTVIDQIGLPTDDCSVDKCLTSANGKVDNLSPAKVFVQIPGSRSQLSIVKENQSYGCSADGEAALPPSKRLHRALEAMSANAAEEDQACAETGIVKTLINENSSTSVRSSSDMIIERKENDGAAEQNIENVDLRGTNTEECIKSQEGPDISIQPVECSKSQEHCEDVLRENVDNEHGENQTVSTTVQQITDSSTDDYDRGYAILCSNQSLSPLKGEGHSERIVSRDVGAEDIHTSEHSVIVSCLVSQADETDKVTSQNGSTVLQCSGEDSGCEKTEPLRPVIHDNNQVNGMSEAKDVRYERREKDISNTSISDDHLCQRDAVVAPSSPVPADGTESPAQTSPPITSICHVSTSESANFVQNSGCSTPNHSHQKMIVCAASVEEEKNESLVPQRAKSAAKWSSYTEAHAALSAFEGALGSLTRTKESIGRATRIAIDCAKFGVSNKVVDILARNLEGESNLHRRVDLFFLVDSITQCSRGLKGDVGGIYPSAIQAVLPRLLSAAAPPGSFAQENRRQCLKVLRLWLERRILPESVIRHHMRELDSLGASSSAGPYSRRSARTERALDDPVRDMEGMLVDEYGSNSSFQLPGFCMPRMLKDEDEGSDSDGESFEAVTPEHNSETPDDQETCPTIEKHTHILEDVDGELEMEDVAPSCETEACSNGGIAGGNGLQNPHDHVEQNFPLPFAPPLPQDIPPSSPPLPTSPPPPPPPPPPPALPPTGPDSYSNGVDSKLYTNSHNMQDDFREAMVQQPPRVNPSSMSNGGHYHATECRDPMQMQMQVCDSTSSFSSYPVQPTHTDGPAFHQKGYPPRPPHRPPPNQFSYVQSGQHVKSRRENPPPPYEHRFHPPHNGDGGNFYNNHDRMRPAPYEHNEGWRYPAPHFSGPHYPDKGRSYSPGPYGGPPREHDRVPHQGWSFPPRGMHNRNYVPFRPPPESAIPVSSRAPSIWRPR